MAEDSNIEVGDDLKSKVNALHMQFFCFCFCQHPSKIPKSGLNQAKIRLTICYTKEQQEK